MKIRDTSEICDRTCDFAQFLYISVTRFNAKSYIGRGSETKLKG